MQTNAATRETYAIGPATFDPARKTVVWKEENIRIVLPDNPNLLLHSIASRKGAVVDKDEVYIDYCRGKRVKPAPKIIDVQICKLRQRLGKLGGHLVTVWGKGYCISLEPAKLHPSWLLRVRYRKGGIGASLQGIYHEQAA